MLEPRVARLETDVAEIKVSMRSVQDTLIRIEAKLGNFATKEDVANLRADTNKQFGDVKESAAEFRADANKQFGDLRAEMNSRFGETNVKISDTNSSTLKWCLGMMLTIALAAFAWQVRQGAPQTQRPPTVQNTPQ
jgi:hypothetical protein